MFGGNRGANFDGFRDGRETGLIDFEMVDAEGQALQVEGALVAGRQDASILVRFTNDLNDCLYAKAGRVGHFETQFAAGALREERQSTEEK